MNPCSSGVAVGARGVINPERPGEAEKVAATRAVIEHEIDWPCLGVSRAITWFFEQVEEGIIYVRQPTSHRRGFRITVG